ncbi:gcn5-related n-acetyltransferase [Seiridium cupressi]
MENAPFQVPVNAIVTTDKCFIRPYNVSDAASLSAAANDPEIARFMRNKFPSPYTLDDAHFFINLSSERTPCVNYAIFLLDGTYAGGIGFIPGGDTEFRTWEVGYWIGKNQWGKGVTTSAVKGFCKWAFTAFPEILRIEAGVYEGNFGSMKVLERAGFLREGVRRKAVVKSGKAFDVTVFGLLREDVEGSNRDEQA